MSDRIIIVDDDPQLTGFLERYLRKQGYDVSCAATAQEFADALQRQSFDLCILDLMLPDRDGFEITRELRLASSLPIIVLTARTEVFDRVVGLELGADDYVTKPFEPRELLARIKAVLRRTQDRRQLTGPEQDRDSAMVFGDWRLNAIERTVVSASNGEPARLTAMEFSLLKALAEHPNRVLSRDQLLDIVHGDGVFVADRAIDVHIARLRRKVEVDPAEPALIKTVRGKGYIFAATVARAR